MLKDFDQEDIEQLTSLIDYGIDSTSDEPTLAKLGDLRRKLNSTEETVYCIFGFDPSELSEIFDANEEKVSEIRHEGLIVLKNKARDFLDSGYLVEGLTSAIHFFNLDEDDDDK